MNNTQWSKCPKCGKDEDRVYYILGKEYRGCKSGCMIKVGI